MTYARREEIFSKDMMSIEEFGEVMGLSYQMAARVIRNIKRKSHRPQMRGVLLVEDFFEYYKITDKQRYLKDMEDAQDQLLENSK